METNTTPTAAHAYAPDKGRNIHCVCGAEYSLAVNMNRHIAANN